MTTNYIENLDAALVRPGRVDVVHKIDDATPHQIKAMFVQFYGEKNGISLLDECDPTTYVQNQYENFPDLDKFINYIATSPVRVSMAALQGYFLQYKNDPISAVDAKSIELFLNRLNSVNPPASAHAECFEDDEIAAVVTRMAAEKRARRGPLSVSDVDRMPFNPQEGWDKF